MRWNTAHELDAHAVGIHQEHDVGPEVAAGLVEDEPAVVEHPFRGRVDVVDVEAQMGEAELVPPLRRAPTAPGSWNLSSWMRSPSRSMSCEVG